MDFNEIWPEHSLSIEEQKSVRDFRPRTQQGRQNFRYYNFTAR